MKKKEHSDALLERLFDAEKRMRVIKLFIRNEAAAFTAKDVAGRLKITTKAAKEHLEKLAAIGFVTARHFRRGAQYQTNASFVLYDDVKNLVVKT
ncbi:MAG: hypothetical protein WC289_03825, partial [Patescibacteria group bacterium]